MDARIPRPGGRYVTGGGQSGIVYDESPEMKAYARWQDETVSLRWNAHSQRVGEKLLEAADLNEITKGLRKLGVDGKKLQFPRTSQGNGTGDGGQFQ